MEDPELEDLRTKFAARAEKRTDSDGKLGFTACSFEDEEMFFEENEHPKLEGTTLLAHLNTGDLIFILPNSTLSIWSHEEDDVFELSITLKEFLTRALNNDETLIKEI